MLLRVLSLDISASSTGWSYVFGANGVRDYGLIKTKPKYSTAERLTFFRQELEDIVDMYRPSHVVIEDVYSGLNVKTLKLLAKFAGVAEEICFRKTGAEPYIISNKTVKAYFKTKNKEDMFHFMVDILDWPKDEVKFKKHNDLTDSIAQLMCYCDKVLDFRKFRTETDYGYKYDKR